MYVCMYVCICVYVYIYIYIYIYAGMYRGPCSNAYVRDRLTRGMNSVTNSNNWHNSWKLVGPEEGPPYHSMATIRLLSGIRYLINT